MSKLIDDICRSDNPIVLDENGDWWIAKPSWEKPLAYRIKDAYRVLVGKSFACHYKQDEKIQR